jgi:hypothetical protein
VISLDETISLEKAWARVAKMRFPHEKVRGCTDRDAWLIGRYYRPMQTVIFPGDDAGKQTPPAELVVEVDRAYFRLALEEEIAAWFKAAGFSGPTIPKKEFEERLAEHRAKPVSAPAVSLEDIRNFVGGYIKDNPITASLGGCRNAWKNAGHGASYRTKLDREYRNQASKKGVLRNRGQRAQIAQN